MATALESAGEIMQLKVSSRVTLGNGNYLRKNRTTNRLVDWPLAGQRQCWAVTYGSTVATACEEFGFHLGLAYQIQDDIWTLPPPLPSWASRVWPIWMQD
jgi:geranylgeranyl pyrophosphate synthase